MEEVVTSLGSGVWMTTAAVLTLWPAAVLQQLVWSIPKYEDIIYLTIYTIYTVLLSYCTLFSFIRTFPEHSPPRPAPASPCALKWFMEIL